MLRSSPSFSLAPAQAEVPVAPLFFMVVVQLLLCRCLLKHLPKKNKSCTMSASIGKHKSEAPKLLEREGTGPVDPQNFEVRRLE